MPTNISPYNLEIDLRQEMIDLFKGGEFVEKWEPFLIRESILDSNKNKIRCTCYDPISNEGKNDCPHCFGEGFVWREKLLPGFKWMPREIDLTNNNSYKSYGGAVGRMVNSLYLVAFPFDIKINENDTLYIPETDGNGGIKYPIERRERYYISGTMDEVFDQGKKDFTIVGIRRK